MTDYKALYDRTIKDLAKRRAERNKAIKRMGMEYTADNQNRMAGRKGSYSYRLAKGQF